MLFKKHLKVCFEIKNKCFHNILKNTFKNSKKILIVFFREVLERRFIFLFTFI